MIGPKRPCTSSSIIRFFSAIIATAGFVALQDKDARAAPPPVVLELFTSQGCSSCPPADALLHDYANRPGVIALSLPVDYWDRLGWKDTFASPAYSARQRDYAQHRGDQAVYTPQIVVNGLYHAVGSVRLRVDQAIAKAQRELKSHAISFKAQRSPSGFVLDFTDVKPRSSGPVSVLIAKVRKSGTVNIRRGENAGRAVTYRNVVTSLERIGTWDGAPGARTYPALKGKTTEAEMTTVVLLQAGEVGPILGAAYATDTR